MACFGNVLRGDDGFGPAVARRLDGCDLPPAVEVMEVGIGGIHLVQELLEPVRRLVLVDAVDRGRPPGTVLVVAPEVTELHSLGAQERRDQLADMHYATPERALMLAHGLGVLPEDRWLVGAQIGDPDQLGTGLSPEIDAAVEVAAAEVRRLVGDAAVTATPATASEKLPR